MSEAERKIARVFPRKTTASPEDPYAFFGPPKKLKVEVEEVHISVAFTYDLPKAERLAREWERIAPLRMGGPALKSPGEDFIPGLYLKPGYVITSRGCPNQCWFCTVPKQEGPIRELPITKGYNLLDNNILACSKHHIKQVFSMLKEQAQRAQLTGGLEAARLDDWVVDLLWDLRPSQMFFAYDTPDDLEPLITAGKKLWRADFTRRHCRCFVLIGYPKDTLEAAQKRLLEAWDAGFMPMAMLWRNKQGGVTKEWQTLQRAWARPAITRSVVKQLRSSSNLEEK